ncbi:hypothetical protein FHU33_3615 [Blastococcus colisei]|uniref:Uncharacterized protein n=1 Tax=Blastococcus colisei TaxID=1564162 RepID=A0A543PJ94_9ACTN|nr:hypothetical protein [Blastococcus colisei]TQN44129.1 hypothetical protein FHU33_3615 [Blastococcus colisei]
MLTAEKDELRRQQISASEQLGGLAWGARRGAATMTALVTAAAATVIVLTLTGCGTGSAESGSPSGGAGTAGSRGAERICPAIDYGRTLIVQLADGWPLAEGRTVVATCPSPYGQVRRGNDELTREVTGALTGSTARLPMMAMPEVVVGAVLGPEGSVVEVEASLSWRRVGGTEECGGPREAVVLLPTS